MKTGQEISLLSHPDSIWTWKSAARRERASVWLPYLDKIEKGKKGWKASYNGGEIIMNLKKVDCIMVYGTSGELPVLFLEELNRNSIPLIIHRRNLSRPYCFVPSSQNDNNDILTKQILYRENDIKRVYIARVLLRHRLYSFKRIMPIPPSIYHRLNACRSLTALRVIEAYYTKRYWSVFYEKCGCQQKMKRRDKEHAINQALNAASVFFMGILLRWILFHKLAPTHGFLHEPSSYASLIYDLMEPVRWIMEDCVIHASEESHEKEKVIAITLHRIKFSLEERVYIPSHLQYARRKSILHGVVLALRAYINGDMKRLVLPMEGEKKCGRPPYVSYNIPGGQPFMANKK